MDLFLPLVFTFLLSLILTKGIISLRHAMGWLFKRPHADRWHQEKTPSFGGVAMFVSFTLALVIFEPLRPEHLKILCGGSLIFLLGFIDDLRPLPPYVKLVGQIVVACLMVILQIHFLLTWNPIFYIPMTVLWIVGITNAFNLLDNMDGLAGGIALIAGFSMVVLVTLEGGGISPGMIVLFIGSIAGFLLLNLHPARVFMGDCGSQWLGFTLACFGILGTWKNVSNLFLMLATPVLILAVPIFDTALVALHRKLHGRPVSQGGRDHTSHRLVALGLSERRTVYLLWGLSILFGLIALFSHLYHLESWVLVVAVSITLILVIGLLVSDARVYRSDSESTRPLPRFLQAQLLYKRRIVELIIDAISIGVAYALAYLLRYDWNLGSFLSQQFAETLPLVLALKMVIFLSLGLYRGLWTYISFEGAMRLFWTLVAASTAVVLLVLGLYRFEGFSRTLFPIDFALLFVFMAGTRALLRAMRESVFAYPESGVRLLMIGGGEACRLLLKEIRRNRQWNLRPVAIVDDDTRKLKKEIYEVPVVGTREDIASVMSRFSIDHAVIAIPSGSPEKINQLEEICKNSNLPSVTMRSLEKSLVQRIHQRFPQ